MTGCPRRTRIHPVVDGERRWVVIGCDAPLGHPDFQLHATTVTHRDPVWGLWYEPGMSEVWDRPGTGL